MANHYETKKEQINSYFKTFARDQIKSVSETVLLASISVKFSVKRDAIREFLENYLTLGLIDKDADGYFGTSARINYQNEMKRREEEMKKEIETAPKTIDEAKDYIKGLGKPE